MWIYIYIYIFQKDQLGTHSTATKIAHELNTDHRSVSHIIDQDLGLCPLIKVYLLQTYHKI